MPSASDRKSLASRLGDAVVRSSAEALTFSARVQPRASRAQVEGVKGGSLRVRLTAPPAEGAANAQLLEVLSREFGLRKSAIRIVKGLSSRDKLVEVTGLK
ncbi:MAG: DUF167 domain-containing protein [Nitrospirota bacterium]